MSVIFLDLDGDRILVVSIGNDGRVEDAAVGRINGALPETLTVLLKEADGVKVPERETLTRLFFRYPKPLKSGEVEEIEKKTQVVEAGRSLSLLERAYQFVKSELGVEEAERFRLLIRKI
jgi:hypothetical protein